MLVWNIPYVTYALNLNCCLSKKEELKEELRGEFENDLTLQLKRQAAAHAEHLADEIATLTAKHEAEAAQALESKINKVSEEYLQQIHTGSNNWYPYYLV